MAYVSSSAIRQIEWNAGVLSVWFRESGRYDYFGVPKELFEAFLAAPSKGAFYNDQIKDQYRLR
ncbi:MAG: KTSC domain-containing protein [Pseudomonadota bacterium]